MASSGTEHGVTDEQLPLISSHRTPGGQSAMAVREWLRQVSVPVFVLVMLFGISSWVDINGLWVELPLLVNELPEGWSLPSYLAIVIQVANIGPVAYTVAARLAPGRVLEWPVIYVVLVTGGAACLMLAAWWRCTLVVAGASRSVALLVLTGLLALVDCTSSVVYLPYMAALRPQYVTALYLGEGLGGLLPGLVGLAQGVGADPECVNGTAVPEDGVPRLVPVYPPPAFGVSAFFCALFAMLVVSGVAFSLLQWLPYCRRARVQVARCDVTSCHVLYQPAATGAVSNGVPPGISGTDPPDTDTGQGQGPGPGGYSEVRAEPTHRDLDGREAGAPRLAPGRWALLLALTAWLSALSNGVVPSAQPFALLPYGSRPYALAVRLAAVANPLSCVLALVVRCQALPALLALVTVGSVLAGYQVSLAALSPSPPLVGTRLGDLLAVTTAVLMSGIFSYVKVSIAHVLRAEGRRALLICGATTQAGSFLGAILSFVLVNVLQVFTSIPPCSQ